MSNIEGPDLPDAVGGLAFVWGEDTLGSAPVREAAANLAAQIGGGVITNVPVLASVAGTSTAYTATDPAGQTGFLAGRVRLFTPHTNSGNAPTLNVTGWGGALALKDAAGASLPTLALLTTNVYMLILHSAAIRVINLDVDLASVAATLAALTSCLAAPYVYSNNGTDADPGAGVFRLNNSDAALVTRIYIDDLDAGAVSRRVQMQAWEAYAAGTIQGRVRLSHETSPQRWVEYRLLNVDAAVGYLRMEVEYVASANMPFPDVSPVRIGFRLTPDRDVAELQAELQLHLAVPQDPIGGLVDEKLRYARAIEGQIVAQITHEGVGRFGPQPVVLWQPYIKASDGFVYIYSDEYGEQLIANEAGATYLAVTLTGIELRILKLKSGVRSWDVFLLDTSITPAGTVTMLSQIVSLGQSNDYGAANSAALTTSTPVAGRTLMFNGGIRVLGPVHGITDLQLATPREKLISAINAVERTDGDGADGNPGESGGCQVMRELASRLPNTKAFLYSKHSIGSTAYSMLKKGTQPYANTIDALKRGWIVAKSRGLTYECLGLDWDQGEGHSLGAQGAYLASLVELQGDFQTDVRAIVGGTPTIPLFLMQLSNFTMEGGTTSWVPQDQLDAMLADPTKIVCVGPKYPFNTSAVDGVHLTKEGQALKGAYVGRARAAYYLGGDPKGLYITAAVIDGPGTHIDLTFHVPVAPITLDTSLVTDPGNYGFEYFDTGGAGSAPTISSVAVTDATHVRLTMSANAIPRTGKAIRVAWTGILNNHGGPTTGARACLRDSAADVSAFGVTMRNYACHQHIVVT